MTDIFSLEGKNAWITGGAYGIGFNIAKAFVAAGAKTIIINVRNEEALARGLQNYYDAGINNVKGYICDVADEQSVSMLVEKVHKEVGQIDILVNNAGAFPPSPMIDADEKYFDLLLYFQYFDLIQNLIIHFHLY